jgi:hypothetical protein
LTRVSIDLRKEAFSEKMDGRAFAAPKGLRPRRRVKLGHSGWCVFIARIRQINSVKAH